MALFTQVRRLLERGGPFELFRGICRFVYWHSGLRSSRYTLKYCLYGTPVTCTVKRISACFEVSSVEEYARASTVHGERSVVADVLQTLDNDDVFYDIGANVGTYSCFAGQMVDDGNVIAFEPHPANVERLRENAALNDIQLGILPVALSSERGVSKLDVSGEEDKAGVGTHSLSTGNAERSIEVDMIEGDRLIEEGQISPPSVMKVDVEGAEQLVLEGLSSALQDDRCHTVYCEVHPDRISEFGGSEDDLRELLSARGFTLEVIENRSPEYFLKAYQNDE